MRELKYPIDNFISYCDEYYKVLDNFSDHSATVVDMGGDEVRNFYFQAYGETAQLVMDEKIIIELNKHLKSVLNKNKKGGINNGR